MAHIIPRISIVIGAAVDTAVTQSLPHTAISANWGPASGMLSAIKVVTPNFTNNVTTIVKLYDRNGVLLWASGALARNSGAAGYFHAVSIPLTYGEYFTAIASGVPGGSGGTVTVDCDQYSDRP